MSTYMRQVTQEEFEILTRFHPGEVRYYVDTHKDIKRNKGAKVRVKRKPKATNSKSANRPTTVNRNQFIQVTTVGAGRMRPDSIQYQIYCAATRLLANDPTKLMSRKDLTEALVKELPQHDKYSRIVPSISSLIKLGKLRYAGTSQSL